MTVNNERTPTVKYAFNTPPPEYGRQWVNQLECYRVIAAEYRTRAVEEAYKASIHYLAT